MEALIFDLDGTLWDSSEGVLKAWNSVLADAGYGADWLSAEKLHGVMGKTIAQIGAEFFPELSRTAQLEMVEACCAMEKDILKAEGSMLYEDLEVVLDALHKRYNLYIVSNCQTGYIETFLEKHRLEKYFKDFESHGRTNLSKGENIRLLMSRNQIQKAIYIGDTQGDLTAAKHAGLPFIYAAYGFGSCLETQPDAEIQRLSALEACAELIFKDFNFLCNP